MKRISYILLGAFCFLIANTLLTGYGNLFVHPAMNEVIVDKFESEFIATAFPLERFKNYTFVFDGSTGYLGTEVNKGGFLSMEEDESEKNALQWIIHGGYSADEPEIFASFRHFYDPTEPAGNRYLHNHLDQLGDINPQMDHMEWALTHPDNLYSWERGLAEVEYALTNNDRKIKESSMASAYRSLGQTLHLIADMGCPSHVRDDSHAAEHFTGYDFGSPDPYEEFFEGFSDIKANFSDGKVDPGLKSFFREAVTVQSIAERLARYTNTNFFTNQTISGKDIVPIIHPEKTYPSPKIEECTYDDLDYTYTKTISGNQVKMCKDLRYRYKIFATRGYPYIDKECVLSQGKAIVPQIIEAGANVIRLFIPDIKVQIDEYNQDLKTIKGTVIHTKSVEYPRVIKYDGKVAIYRVKDNKKIMELECTDGEFESDINPNDFKNIDWKKDGIYAGIEFGGINVKSDPFTENVTVKAKRIKLDISFYASLSRTDNQGEQTYNYWLSIYAYSMTHITQTGNSITAVIDSTYSDRGDNFHRKVLANITMKGTSIVTFEISDTLFSNFSQGDNQWNVTDARYIKSKENPYTAEQCNYAFGAYIYYGVTHVMAGVAKYELAGICSNPKNNYRVTLLNILPDDSKDCTIEIYD